MGTRIIGAFVTALILGIAIGWALRGGPSAQPAPVAAAPAPFFADQGGKVGTFDGGVVTDEELRALLEPPFPPADLRTVDEALLVELLAAEALDRSLQRDPAVAANLKRVLAEGVRRRHLDELARAQAQDDQALRDWYEAHRTEFVRPERVVVQDALVAVPNDPAGRRAALARAQGLVKAAQGLDAAGFLARASAVAVVNERSYSLPDAEAALGSDNARKAFLMTRIGEVQLFEAQDGLHVVRHVGREAPLNVPFDQAKPQVTARRWYELRAKALDELSARLPAERGLQLDRQAVEKLTPSP